MTSDERATMLEELEELAADSYWGIRVDELRELLQAHEEHEAAIGLLREVPVNEPAHTMEMRKEECPCWWCRRRRVLLRPQQRQIKAAAACVHAAHDARTAGTAAREGGGDG